MKRRSVLEQLLFPSGKVNPEDFRKAVNHKTVLITGATYGIGAAVAYGIAQPGVTLILIARTEQKLFQLKEELENQGASVHVFRADLTVPAEVSAVLNFIEKSGLEIDIVISNAGKSIRRSIFDALDRFHDFKRTMALNYDAPVQLLLKLIPILEKKQGQIINISAINVLLAPAPYWAAYQASKTAFDMWLRSVAPELKIKGIATTSVYLPLVRTRMIEPTIAYRNVPAMQPEAAAQIIFKAMIKRSRIYTPWWSFPFQVFSVLFRRQWEYFSIRHLKQQVKATSAKEINQSHLNS